MLIGYFSSRILLFYSVNKYVVTFFYLSLIQGKNISFNEILARKMMRLGCFSDIRIFCFWRLSGIFLETDFLWFYRALGLTNFIKRRFFTEGKKISLDTLYSSKVLSCCNFFQLFPPPWNLRRNVPLFPLSAAHAHIS